MPNRAFYYFHQAVNYISCNFIDRGTEPEFQTLLQDEIEFIFPKKQKVKSHLTDMIIIDLLPKLQLHYFSEFYAKNPAPNNLEIKNNSESIIGSK